MKSKEQPRSKTYRSAGCLFHMLRLFGLIDITWVHVSPLNKYVDDYGDF